MIFKGVSRCAAAILFVCAVSTNSRADVIYDAAADFEAGFTAQSNPNDVWSYGYSSGFTSAVTLFTQTSQPGINGPNAQFWSSPTYGLTPSVEFNDGSAINNGNIDFAANQLVLVAGAPLFADLVFTAPAAGSYSVTSSFLGDQNAIGTVVGVVENGDLVFSSSVTALGQTVPFDNDVSLTAGETVVFSVGPGGGNQNTGLDATITYTSPTSVPEPASLTLLGTALIGLGAARRRRKRKLA
jgi:hypothetical protein